MDRHKKFAWNFESSLLEPYIYFMVLYSTFCTIFSDVIPILFSIGYNIAFDQTVITMRRNLRKGDTYIN